MTIARPIFSPFAHDIPVAYLPLNNGRSHAFAVYGPDVPQPCIIIDEAVFEQDWFSNEHLMILLAHETGHIQNLSTNERAADQRGLQLVKMAGMPDVFELYQAEVDHRQVSGHYLK